MNVRAHLAALFFSAMAVFPASAQDKLVIWWGKGYYESEDRAIRAIAAAWEKKSGVKVELSLYGMDDTVTKSVSAVEAGSPPDIAYSIPFEFRTVPEWAYVSKVENLADVMNPVKDRFLSIAVRSASFLNKATGKRDFYAVPIGQNIMLNFHWADLLKQAGFSEKDIPKDWFGYWDFWCDKVQPALRSQGKRNYGAGLTMSTNSIDTFSIFNMWLNAWNVRLVDEDGKLLTSDPKVREGTINALKHYVSIYQKGCTPPSSINWTDADNNSNFNNKTLVMTSNPGLSIAGKAFDDKNFEAYNELIKTSEFPSAVDGTPITHMATVKLAVVFQGAKNKAAAKSFLSFLLEPDNYNALIEASAGRLFPVTTDGLQRPFWSDGKDPHRSVAYKLFTANGRFLPFQQIYNHRFSAVNSENVWGRAMSRVIQDKVSVEQAVDEMFTRMAEILKS